MAMYPDSKRTERSKVLAMTRRENIRARQASKRVTDANVKALKAGVK